MILDLQITILDNDVSIDDLGHDNIEVWGIDDYRALFKACNVHQKIELFDKVKTMKALAIKFTDEYGTHTVFMPAEDKKI